MTHTPPPPRESGSLNAIWFILGALVILAIIYYAFFAGGPAATPTAGTGDTNVTVESPASPPAVTTPAPPVDAPAATPAPEPTSPEPAPATPATPAPAPAN